MNKLFMRVTRILCAFLGVCAALPVWAGPSYGVFEDGFGAGWSSQPWGATVTTSSSYYFKGAKSAKVVFTTAMGVFKPVASGGFSTTGYKDLTFAVYNSSDADDLWLVAQTTGGTLGTYLRVADYSDRGAIPAGKWSWVRIPIAHLGLGSAPKLAFFSVASGKANATAYFDEVEFAASSILYEGVATSSGPGIQPWSWNVTISAPSRNDSNYWIKVTPNAPWGGVQFQHRVGGMVAGDYGAVAVRFRQEGTPIQQILHITLADSLGRAVGSTLLLAHRYVPDGIQFVQGEWYHLTIPMSDFGVDSYTEIGGVIIESNTALRFWIDDVRLVQKLNWVMGSVPKTVSGYVFGEHWLEGYCSTYRKLHVGNDYSDNAASGRAIYAASRGFVKEVPDMSSGGWGYAVILQHERGFTTSYLHLATPLVKAGDEVQRGTKLGTTTSLTMGSHLHFGARVTDYETSVSKVGALPEAACTIEGFLYPAFPAGFIDSEKMDWAGLP